MCVCMDVYMLEMCIYVCTCMHVQLCAICIYVYMYASVWEGVHICICIYIYVKITFYFFMGHLYKEPIPSLYRASL